MLRLAVFKGKWQLLFIEVIAHKTWLHYQWPGSCSTGGETRIPLYAWGLRGSPLTALGWELFPKRRSTPLLFDLHVSNKGLPVLLIRESEMNRGFREVGTAPQQGGERVGRVFPTAFSPPSVTGRYCSLKAKWDLVCMLERIRSREDFHPAHTESFWPAGPDSWVPGAFTPYQVTLMALSVDYQAEYGKQAPAGHSWRQNSPPALDTATAGQMGQSSLQL